MNSPFGQRPFEGIRIIDITHVLAGPFAAYQLGLMGADVIKVEHPDDPDQSRDSGSDNDLNHLGGAFDGTRLNKLYRKDVDDAAIVASLGPLLREYAERRSDGERFGDYVIRAGHVRPTTAGNAFHSDLAPDLRS